MATSPFFNHLEHSGEKAFYDEIVVESIQITGFDVSYIRRKDFEVDPVLYEPSESVFEHSFRIEANIPEGLMSWDGEGTILNQFGITTLNTGSIYISKTRWEQIMEDRQKEGKETWDRPYEGDLIYFGYGHKAKFNNTIFIINQVDFTDYSWMLGRNFCYRLRCSLYAPSSEDKFIAETPDLEISRQIEDTLDANEVVRQNENITQVTDIIKEFSETHPFGGF